MQMATSIETDSGEMIVKRVSVPIGLEEVMEGLTREILLKKPKDIYIFASEYFARLLDLRNKGNFKGGPPKKTQSIIKPVRRPDLSINAPTKSLETLKANRKMREDKVKSILEKRKSRKDSSANVQSNVSSRSSSLKSNKSENLSVKAKPLNFKERSRARTESSPKDRKVGKAKKQKVEVIEGCSMTTDGAVDLLEKSDSKRELSNDRVTKITKTTGKGKLESKNKAAPLQNKKTDLEQNNKSCENEQKVDNSNTKDIEGNKKKEKNLKPDDNEKELTEVHVPLTISNSFGKELDNVETRLSINDHNGTEQEKEKNENNELLKEQVPTKCIDSENMDEKTKEFTQENVTSGMNNIVEKENENDPKMEEKINKEIKQTLSQENFIEAETSVDEVDKVNGTIIGQTIPDLTQIKEKTSNFIEMEKTYNSKKDSIRRNSDKQLKLTTNSEESTETPATYEVNGRNNEGNNKAKAEITMASLNFVKNEKENILPQEEQSKKSETNIINTETAELEQNKIISRQDKSKKSNEQSKTKVKEGIDPIKVDEGKEQNKDGVKSKVEIETKEDVLSEVKMDKEEVKKYTLEFIDMERTNSVEYKSKLAAEFINNVTNVALSDILTETVDEKDVSKKTAAEAQETLKVKTIDQKITGNTSEETKIKNKVVKEPKVLLPEENKKSVAEETMTQKKIKKSLSQEKILSKTIDKNKRTKSVGVLNISSNYNSVNKSSTTEQNKSDAKDQPTTKADKGKIRKSTSALSNILESKEEKPKTENTVHKGSNHNNSAKMVKTVDKASAVVKIQSHWKGFKVRTELKRSNLDKKVGAVIKIQAMVRGFLTRKRNKPRSGKSQCPSSRRNSAIPLEKALSFDSYKPSIEKLKYNTLNLENEDEKIEGVINKDNLNVLTVLRAEHANISPAKPAQPYETYPTRPVTSSSNAAKLTAEINNDKAPSVPNLEHLEDGDSKSKDLQVVGQHHVYKRATLEEPIKHDLSKEGPKIVNENRSDQSSDIVKNQNTNESSFIDDRKVIIKETVDKEQTKKHIDTDTQKTSVKNEAVVNNSKNKSNDENKGKIDQEKTEGVITESKTEASLLEKQEQNKSKEKIDNTEVKNEQRVEAKVKNNEKNEKKDTEQHNDKVETTEKNEKSTDSNKEQVVNADVNNTSGMTQKLDNIKDKSTPDIKGQIEKNNKVMEESYKLAETEDRKIDKQSLENKDSREAVNHEKGTEEYKHVKDVLLSHAINDSKDTKKEMILNDKQESFCTNRQSQETESQSKSDVKVNNDNVEADNGADYSNNANKKVDQTLAGESKQSIEKSEEITPLLKQQDVESSAITEKQLLEDRKNTSQKERNMEDTKRENEQKIEHKPSPVDNENERNKDNHGIHQLNKTEEHERSDKQMDNKTKKAGNERLAVEDKISALSIRKEDIQVNDKVKDENSKNVKSKITKVAQVENKSNSQEEKQVALANKTSEEIDKKDLTETKKETTDGQQSETMDTKNITETNLMRMETTMVTEESDKIKENLLKEVNKDVEIENMLKTIEKTDVSQFKTNEEHSKVDLVINGVQKGKERLDNESEKVEEKTAVKLTEHITEQKNESKQKTNKDGTNGELNKNNQMIKNNKEKEKELNESQQIKPETNFKTTVIMKGKAAAEGDFIDKRNEKVSKPTEKEETYNSDEVNNASKSDIELSKEETTNNWSGQIENDHIGTIHKTSEEKNNEGFKLNENEKTNSIKKELKTTQTMSDEIIREKEVNITNESGNKAEEEKRSESKDQINNNGSRVIMSDETDKIKNASVNNIKESQIKAENVDKDNSKNEDDNIKANLPKEILRQEQPEAKADGHQITEKQKHIADESPKANIRKDEGSKEVDSSMSDELLVGNKVKEEHVPKVIIEKDKVISKDIKNELNGNEQENGITEENDLETKAALMEKELIYKITKNLVNEDVLAQIPEHLSIGETTAKNGNSEERNGKYVDKITYETPDEKNYDGGMQKLPILSKSNVNEKDNELGALTTNGENNIMNGVKNNSSNKFEISKSRQELLLSHQFSNNLKHDAKNNINDKEVVKGNGAAAKLHSDLNETQKASKQEEINLNMGKAVTEEEKTQDHKETNEDVIDYEDLDKTDLSDEDKAAAAIKIQSRYRGYRTRTQLHIKRRLSDIEEQKELELKEGLKDVHSVKEATTFSINSENGEIELGKQEKKLVQSENVQSAQEEAKGNLLHSGEFHDTLIIPSSLNRTKSSGEKEDGSKFLHTSELHDSVVLPLTKLETEASKKVNDKPNEERSKTIEEETQVSSVDFEGRSNVVLPLSVQLDQASPAGAKIVTPYALKSSPSLKDSASASLKDSAPCAYPSPDAKTSHATMDSNITEKRNHTAKTTLKNVETDAATKIQAGFRGYQVRKQMKNKMKKLKRLVKSHKNETPNQRRSTKHKNAANPNEDSSNDLEEQSAVKIQAGVRGFLVRRRQKKQKENEPSP